MSRPAYLEMGTNCSPALPRPSHPIYSHIYGQMAGGSEWEGCASQKNPGGSERGKGVGTKGGGREGGRKKKKKKVLSKKVLDVLRNAVSPLGKYISVRRSLPAACTRPAPRPARINPAAPPGPRVRTRGCSATFQAFLSEAVRAGTRPSPPPPWMPSRRRCRC